MKDQILKLSFITYCDCLGRIIKSGEKTTIYLKHVYKVLVMRLKRDYLDLVIFKNKLNNYDLISLNKKEIYIILFFD